MLISRAATDGVGQKLEDLILWWEDYVPRNGGEIDNNPTLGNKRGGQTTIVEKSLGGAIAKAGTSQLVNVYRYAEHIRDKGMILIFIR